MRFLRVLLLVVSAFFCMTSLNAQNRPQETMIGGCISLAAENETAEGGVGLSAFIDFPLNTSILGRASIGRFGSDTKVDKLSEGDYSQVWIEGSLLYAGAPSKLQPYVGGGVGYYLFGHEISSRVESALLLRGLRGKEEIKDLFGFHVRAGANIELTPTLQLVADVRYAILKPEAEVTITDLITFDSITVGEKVELNTLTVSIGIRLTL